MMRGFGYGGRMGYGGIGAGEILLILFGLLALAGIVLLIVWAVRASSHGHQGASGVPPQQPSAGVPDGHAEAIAIAKRRLASGEITPDQYSEIMRTLGE